MKRKSRTLAVTGLNATDNPAPGVGVLRSLALDASPGQRLIGLAYDALDPGIYAKDLASDIFMLCYPSSGTQAFLSRIAYIHEKVGLDVIIPTLDAELPAFIAIQDELREMGIGMALPSREQFDLRSKASLAALGKKAGITVPHTVVLSNSRDLARIHETLSYPFFVKGVFYGATLVTCYEEAQHAFHKAAASWGLPVIAQAPVSGQELNVVAVGDGRGNMLGAVPMKKLFLTDKGKGWAGITVADRELLSIAEKFILAAHWRGPCEVEVIRSKTGEYHLLEVNPRFPAWVHLAAAAGMNLPETAVELACGCTPAPKHEYEVGKMFVRISLDQIAGLETFERIVTQGELKRGPDGVPRNSVAATSSSGTPAADVSASNIRLSAESGSPSGRTGGVNAA